MVAAPDCLSQGQALLQFRDSRIPKLPVGPPSTLPNLNGIIPADRRPADVTARTAPVPQASIQQRYCTYLK